jgi:hypothetical protein
MRLRYRVERLEDWQWRGGHGGGGVHSLTDAELEAIIARELGCAPDSITDEMLQAIVSEADQ